MLAFIAIARDAAHRDELLASRRYHEADFFLVGQPGDSIEKLAGMLPKSVTRITTPDGDWTPPKATPSALELPADMTPLQGNTSPTRDIAAVTCFFNPAGFKTLRRNYDTFAARMSDVAEFYTIECAYHGQPFTITGPNVIGVRSNSPMFHKERLLNLAIAALPSYITKVAWVDCDLVFSRQDWLWQASDLLDDYPVVQCFERVNELNQDGILTRTSEGLAQARRNGRMHYARPGFAWAARLDLLRSVGGLFDRCVVGSGDVVFGNLGCYGEFDHGCVANYAEHLRREAKKYARAVFDKVNRRVGVVASDVWHLWHGDAGNRRYHERDRLMDGYTPEWLKSNADGVWEWDKAPAPARKAVADYFIGRQEDAA